jgi:hypothetical protein
LGFSVANGPCSVTLHPAHIAAGVNVAAPPNNISDIGHMATIISSLMGGPALLSRQALQTPPRVGTQPTIASLVIPTLTKLTHFLHHAAVNLGIPAARTFESSMCQNSFGPDILHVVQAQDLVDLAMTKGDVICLKAGAQDWWKGPEARNGVMLRWKTASAPDPAPINQAIQIHNILTPLCLRRKWPSYFRR